MSANLSGQAINTSIRIAYIENEWGIKMADEIDRASDQEQVLRDSAIYSARQVRNIILSTGKCLQCDAVVDGERRWCDEWCRNDWQKWHPEA